MPIPIRPSYRNAYLVAEDSGAPPLVAVGRKGSVWRIYLLGVQSQDQPREAFATREEADVRLLELTRRET